MGREHNEEVPRRILCNDVQNHRNLGPRRPQLSRQKRDQREREGI